VGGWVRDALLHQPSADVDIATSATAAEVRRRCLIAGAGHIECCHTDQHFGSQVKKVFKRAVLMPNSTVLVVVDSQTLEVTPFRGLVQTPWEAAAAADAGSAAAKPNLSFM
jgi:tRNA nucleotidyltransferase/poly(A) polymerase